ncbi:carboxylesterase/lipase family protein [Acutalibacter caecimuris]|uniref:carboxylesterase/lipase family protein n=1 Tax=Acutalibacter caecimuris TaxID=3093657 RepID=UPI002AC96473|nr:carboxylesterase family protein [Acutalibacter sp. M00118]
MAKQFVCSTTEPIVQTKAGKLRGFIVDGTYTFHGIKYADAKRFQPPTPPQSWQGVRDALSYGYVSPMLDRETAQGEIMVPHRYWPKDENCQYLNIWSQSIDPAAKKPVMVWLHGGGFSAGSSIEQIAYDGENLSKFGDVVVVTLNHRLNILGYLDLSPYGEKYKNSGNAGNADLVAALEWVRDNIANFGGDPDNVTIFGQSGGGAKVFNLMQIPSADGLFHKGIIMSGVFDGILEAQPDRDSRPLIDAMLGYLGLAAADIEQLETVAYEKLAEAYKAVAPGIAQQGHYTGNGPIENDFYVGDPRKVGFTDHAKTIPVIIGSVFGEFAFAPGIPQKYDLTEEEQMAMLRKRLKDGTEEVARLFKECYPEKNLTDVLSLDAMCREASKDFARKKGAHPEAATYCYLFNFELPLDDGHPAWHCADIPFFFHNTDKVFICNVPGVSDLLEDRMAGSFVNFARYGVPSHPSLPAWAPCTGDTVATMIFDQSCSVRYNHDDALYKAYLPVAPNPFAPPEEGEDKVFLH